jgi:drug/metabolite transporter (DMT)-like permease
MSKGVQSSMLPVMGLLVTMALWGSSFIALKIAFTGFDPLVAVFFRMTIASCMFIPFFRLFRTISYQKGDWKPLLLMAFCEPCLYFVFEALALSRTSASQAGMVTATLPLLVALVAVPLLKEKVSVRTLTGFCVAIAGVVWMTLHSDVTDAAPEPVLGNLLEFLAMVCATGYSVSVRYLSPRYPAIVLTAVQSVAGMFFFAPVFLLPGTEVPTTFPLAPTLAVVYLGSVVTLGAYCLFNYGIASIGASRASAFINLIPVFTLFFGWTILGERFTALQFLGAAMVFAGVFLSQESGREVSETTKEVQVDGSGA